MNDKLDQLSRRLAVGYGRTELEGTSRRSFVLRTARAAAALGTGLIAASAGVSASAARRCRPPESAYRIAEQDGIITDALGTRFVKRGDYILLDNPVDAVCVGEPNGGDVSIQNSAYQCGISYFTTSFGSTTMDNNWTLLSCRACPWQTSTVQAEFTDPYATIGVSYGTTAGQKICKGGFTSDASSVWYRTSGPIGCWFWSGGTDSKWWNTTC